MTPLERSCQAWGSVTICLLPDSVIDHGTRLDALAQDHHRSLVAARRDQAIHPGVEAQPVDEHELGACQLPGIGRQRLEYMRIAVGADQDDHLGLVAGDLFDHVPQNAEARDDANCRRHVPAEPALAPAGRTGSVCSSGPSPASCFRLIRYNISITAVQGFRSP